VLVTTLLDVAVIWTSPMEKE